MTHLWQTAKLYFKDRVVLAGTSVTLVSWQLAVWPLWLRFADLPDEVPLWYTAPPLDQLAKVEYLWLLPGLALVIWLINTGLGIWLYRRHVTVSQMLVVLAAGISVLATTAVLKTILIFTELF